ncbi:hypothetical protein M0R45_005161 [Rubus argutus]|uniref:Uncharacterized protein n=1 Tax=Rubus argutus TaxID=59490 RepID=A0AAW1YM47_RUBAR
MVLLHVPEAHSGQGMSATWREGTVSLAAVTVTAEDGAVGKESVYLFTCLCGAIHGDGGGPCRGWWWWWWWLTMGYQGCGAHRPGTMWGQVWGPLWSRLEASGFLRL